MTWAMKDCLTPKKYPHFKNSEIAWAIMQLVSELAYGHSGFLMLHFNCCTFYTQFQILTLFTHKLFSILGLFTLNATKLKFYFKFFFQKVEVTILW